MGDENPDKEKLEQAAYIANLDEFLSTLPRGIETRIGEEGTGLSHGQKQRVLIARAVYRNPEVFFFDEATNSLDSANEKIILGRLDQFYQGKTVVIVAHRLSTVKNAHQIIVLGKGRIIEQGDHSGLIAKKGVYFDLVSNQLELGE
jgi:ATP-binding cassette subfamily B protein